MPRRKKVPPTTPATPEEPNQFFGQPLAGNPIYRGTRNPLIESPAAAEPAIESTPTRDEMIAEIRRLREAATV